MGNAVDSDESYRIKTDEEKQRLLLSKCITRLNKRIKNCICSKCKRNLMYVKTNFYDYGPTKVNEYLKRMVCPHNITKHHRKKKKERQNTDIILTYHKSEKTTNEKNVGMKLKNTETKKLFTSVRTFSNSSKNSFGEFLKQPGCATERAFSSSFKEL